MKYCREGNQQFETLQGKWDIKIEHCREERHKNKLHKKLLIKVCVSVTVFVFLFACYYPPPLSCRTVGETHTYCYSHETALPPSVST